MIQVTYPAATATTIESIGDEDVQILFGFNSGVHQSISASEWFGKNPTQLLAANFGLPESVFSKFVLDNQFVRKGTRT